MKHVVAAGLIALGTASSGCTCDGPANKPQPVASSSASSTASASAVASATPSRTPRPTHPAPKATSFEVTTSDGVRIEASRWEGGKPTDPVVVLVHRLGGSRSEWTPLIERIFPPKHPMNVVAFDLRGHGQSKSGKAGAKLAWQSFDNAAFEKMDADVSAVIDRALAKKPRALVLVGSDIGATLVVRHANERKGDVAGVALMSPGAALRGLDIYKPFSAILGRPNLIVTGSNDTVSHKASKSLAAMSKTTKLVTLEARGHGAQYLGEERWESWDELADWVESRVAPAPAAPASASASSSASGSAAPPPLASAPSPRSSGH